MYTYLSKSIIWSVAIACVVVFGLPQLETAIAAPQPKVDICHIPPGAPWNFHTISVSENAEEAHLAHGDKLGACGLFSEELCDDNDACTIDAFVTGTEMCQEPGDRLPTDCSDGIACTDDSCDSVLGCANVANDANCDSGEVCDPVEGCVPPPLPACTYEAVDATSCLLTGLSDQNLAAMLEVDLQSGSFCRWSTDVPNLGGGLRALFCLDSSCGFGQNQVTDFVNSTELLCEPDPSRVTLVPRTTNASNSADIVACITLANSAVNPGHPTCGIP